MVDAVESEDQGWDGQCGNATNVTSGSSERKKFSTSTSGFLIFLVFFSHDDVSATTSIPRQRKMRGESYTRWQTNNGIESRILYNIQ
jgi:hypothetical protein